MIDSIRGRLNDWIILPDGSRRMFQPFWNTLREFAQIIQFRVIQEATDRLRILVVHDPTMARGDLDRVLADKFAQDSIAPGMHIVLDWVDRIPPDPSGKLRVLVNHVHASDSNHAESCE